MRFRIGRGIVVTAFLSLVVAIFSPMGMNTVHAEDNNTTSAYGYEEESTSDNAAALDSLTVQPSAADTYIRNGASSSNNFADKTSIYLKKSIEGYERRGILAFDFSALEDSATITSAYLDLYYVPTNIGNNPVGEIVEVNRLEQTGWLEGETTWNDYKNATLWTTAGGDFTVTDQSAASMPGAFGWVRWTVTEQVRYAQSNTSEIAHMLLKVSDSAPLNTAARFYSKEFGTNPSQQPKLIINFTTNDVTTPPPGSCELSLPDSANNDEVIGVSLSYPEVPIGVGVEELYTFNWPSECVGPQNEGFKMRTTISKIEDADTFPGQSSGSFVSVVVPGALCIRGQMTATAQVFWDGSLLCTATATMMVEGVGPID